MDFSAGSAAGRRDGDAGAAAGRAEGLCLEDWACGAGWSCGGLACAGLPKGMRAALWLPIAAGMMRIAAGRAEKPLRAAGLLLAAAGCSAARFRRFPARRVPGQPGFWLGAAAAPLLSAATVCLRRMRQSATHVRVRMTCGGRTAAFTAMVDSGNCLRDYLTHRPVIVMPQARIPALRAGKHAAAADLRGYGGRTADDALPDARGDHP